ncbi:glycosyltransferase [uncultured Arcticibacterium sp.]|uniref:glycosyltransferase n=1 Tax=uncultured Arcticibacterium sp. TaxID=2173042 RepID=UPI0030F90638
MRVAFINIDDTLGGASIACVRLAETLEKKGLDVTIFTQKKNTEKNIVQAISEKWWLKKITFLNFLIERTYFFFYEKDKSVRFSFSPSISGIDITKYVDLKTFDIIHLHWTNFGFLSNTSIKRIFDLNIPIVWTMHDMWLMTGGCHHSGDCLNFQTGCGECEQYLKRPSTSDLSFRLNQVKFELFKKKKNIHIVGCSEWISNRARKSKVLGNLKITTIPNPLNQRVFFPINKENAKESMALEEKKTYILFSAMKVSVSWKGYGYLKESLEILYMGCNKKEAEGIEVLIVGEAAPESKHDFRFKTHILGRINDPDKLNTIYNTADIFVSSSIQENLPNTLIEALACGTPCAAFNIGGIPEIIDHKKNGFLAKYKSSESLAEGIQWVLRNNDDKQLSLNAREKVNKFFSEDVVAKKYLELYNSVLECRS